MLGYVGCWGSCGADGPRRSVVRYYPFGNLGILDLVSSVIGVAWTFGVFDPFGEYGIGVNWGGFVI
jgi:hypothetical protein